MKLSTIAVSIIAVVGVIATGGSWYTGKQVEERYQSLLTQTNDELKGLNEQGIQAEIADVAINRGLFSSDVTYKVKVVIEDKSYIAQGNDKLFHGPFPLNRLAKGNLLPVLASIDNKLSAVSDELKGVFNGQGILSGQSTFDYSGNIAVDYNINPWALPDGSLTVGAITNKGNYIPNKKYPSLGEGDFDITVSTINFVDPDAPDTQATFENMTLKGSSSVKNERYLSEVKIGSDVSQGSKSVSYTAKAGRLNFDFAMESDAQAFNDVIPYFNDANAIESEASQAMQTLMTKGAVIKFKDVSLTNEKGKSDFSLIADLKPFDMAQVKSLSDAISLFKQSSMSFNLNLAFAEQLFLEKAKLDGLSDEDAKEQAKLTIKEMLDSA
ncbi:hypothetical protein BMT54_01035 [Pasteurellaceae bacterium 15-036681]|nr:hypothetical protein BMT54_01035 [Pasteurellaceae bacterium 15-036681]